MTELKPCPFCGGQATAVDCGVEWFVRCSRCGANREKLYRQRCDAVRAWNTRKYSEADDEKKETCGDCRNFIRNPGKAYGFCARKTVPLRYYGQRPEMQKTCRSRPRCKKMFEAREEPKERVCRTCWYHRDYGNRMVCFGQKDAPPVDPDETCESWKSLEGTK